ncbi:MAG: hypothetical protein IB618_01695 [Candidatus Pacearchaeota archaeon]|nr:MAG: hypothetical protein IB618_01695 [Candidatus Pacearchaeota archaeon]
MKKQAVVWVSTVLYILISLAILGIVLAAVQPRIKAARDKAAIDQTVNMLNELDQKIIEVDSSAEGNVRSISLQLKRGILIIDKDEDEIKWTLEDSSYKYSEPGTTIIIGRIKALTEEVPGGFNVTLTLDYQNNLNITSSLVLQPAEIPYKVFMKNEGLYEKLNQIKIYST